MAKSFSTSDIVRVRKSLEFVVKDLEKLDDNTLEHKRKIRDLIKDVKDIEDRFDHLMILLKLEED